MKHFSLLALSLGINFVGFSQAIPNAGFETWHIDNEFSSGGYSVPLHWITSDQVAADHFSFPDSSVVQTASSYSGAYAVKMQTWITNGGVDTVSGTIFSIDSLWQTY